MDQFQCYAIEADCLDCGAGLVKLMQWLVPVGEGGPAVEEAGGSTPGRWWATAIQAASGLAAIEPVGKLGAMLTERVEGLASFVGWGEQSAAEGMAPYLR